MKNNVFMLFIILLATSGCTVIKADPLSPDVEIGNVKIIENPTNRVDDFVPLCQGFFAQFGVQTVLMPENYAPNPEDFIFHYETRRSWDLKLFMSYAHVQLFHGNKLLASGTYHAWGGMFSLAFTKLNPTEWKMRRVFDAMFPEGIRVSQKPVAIFLKPVNDDFIKDLK